MGLPGREFTRGTGMGTGIRNQAAELEVEGLGPPPHSSCAVSLEGPSTDIMSLHFVSLFQKGRRRHRGRGGVYRRRTAPHPSSRTQIWEEPGS